MKSSPTAATAIAVFAFRRPDLLEQTLQSLETADRFSDFPVHVFSDGARLDVPGETDAVESVREFLRPWCRTHNAELVESPANLGLRRSITGGITNLLSRYHRVIVVEDDLALSPSFLVFMSEALEALKDREDILQVSGYFVPHTSTLTPVGLLRTPGSWGWGTWRRAWIHYNDNADELLAAVLVRDPKAFDLNGSYAFLDALRHNAEGKLDTWAVRWYASMFLRRGLALYPAQSLTRNIGFGEDATNCAPSATAGTFMSQPLAGLPQPVDWENIGGLETREYAEVLEQFYRWQQAEWAKPTWRERLEARLQFLVRGGASD